MTTDHPNRRKTDKVVAVLMWLTVFNLVATGTAVIVMLGMIGAVKADEEADLRAVRLEEQRSTDLVRRASWRLCERAMRDRALLHAALITDPIRDESPEEAAARTAFRELLEQQNPIVDCDPNLVGEPAYALSRAGQRAFVRQWQRGELEPLPEPPGAVPGINP